MHAAGLTRALLEGCPHLTIAAVGGDHLRDAGAEIVYETVAKARFGLSSFLRAGEVWSMLRDLRRRWRVSPPRLVVACDSWTMNKHVLKLAREFGCRTMYYVSPQVWASREGRIERLKQLADEVACILPFEEAWLRERGVRATFVGHPLFDDLPPPAPTSSDNVLRIALNFGSRGNTVAKNMPGLLAAADQLRQQHAEASFITPVTSATRSFVQQHAPPWLELGDDFDAVVSQATFALTVSGTATLHTAAHNVPMVVVYRGNRLLWETLGKRIVKTRTFSLVNLLHPQRRRVVEEIIPWSGEPRPVVAAARKLLDDPGAMERQRRELAAVVDPLRNAAAGKAAAAMALRLLNEAQ
jgi:lipid-A-disaccharide synthase